MPSSGYVSETVSVTGYLLIKIDLVAGQSNRYRKMSTGNSEFTAEFFDESSRAWMANKVRRGASMAYKCEAKTKAGNVCVCSAVMKNPMDPRLCAKHKHSKLD